MLESHDPKKERSMFSLSNELLRLARAQAEELVRTGDARSPVQESEYTPQFLVTRNEEDVIVLQRMEIGDGPERVIFFIGVAKS